MGFCQPCHAYVHPMYVIITKHPDPKKAIEDLYNRSLAGEDFACLVRELAWALNLEIGSPVPG